MIKMIRIEEGKKTQKSPVGEAVEFFIDERIISELCGMATVNRPRGLLFLSLKFTMYIIKVVKSTDILALSDTHIAIF